MKVFRLEKDGQGPYRYEGGLDQLGVSLLSELHAAHDDSDHPGFYDDFDNDENDEMFCDECRFGFKSLRDLKSWFRGYLTKLTKIGFKIVVYEINKDRVVISKSKKQVIFLP